MKVGKNNKELSVEISFTETEVFHDFLNEFQNILSDDRIQEDIREEDIREEYMDKLINALNGYGDVDERKEIKFYADNKVANTITIKR